VAGPQDARKSSIGSAQSFSLCRMQHGWTAFSGRALHILDLEIGKLME